MNMGIEAAPPRMNMGIEAAPPRMNMGIEATPPRVNMGIEAALGSRCGRMCLLLPSGEPRISCVSQGTELP